MEFPIAEVAHAIEWVDHERFKPMRSRAIGGKHREYLDLREVAAAFDQTFAAGTAQSRLDIARLVMRCAVILLKPHRPDTAIIDTILMPLPRALSGTSGNRSGRPCGGLCVGRGDSVSYQRDHGDDVRSTSNCGTYAKPEMRTVHAP